MKKQPPSLHNADIAALSWRLYTENEQKIYRLERKRRGHLLFLAAACLLLTPPALLLGHIMTGGALLAVHARGFWSVPLYLGTYITLLAFFGAAFDRRYRRRIKRDLMSAIADSAGLTYRAGGVLEPAGLMPHLVIPPYDSITCEEGFRACHGEHRYAFQDFSLRTASHMKLFDIAAQTRSVSMRGILLRIELNRALDHHTVLIPSSMTGLLTRQSHNEKFVELTPVNLVFRRFTRHYNVLSTHQVAARYILDPDMMERLIALAEQVRAKWLGVSFMGREAVIFLQYRRNPFEIGHLLHPVGPSSIARVLGEVAGIQGIIDTLALHEKAGWNDGPPRGNGIW